MGNKKLDFIPIITGLRGIAAVMVCLYHFVCTTTGYFSDEFVLKLFANGKFGVHVFFVISGVVLPLSMINGNYKLSHWNTFLKKRIIRIEPPYLVVLLLGILYMYLRSFVSTSSNVDLVPDWRGVMLHIGYLIPFFEDFKWLNGAFWTLAVEFQYYLFLILSFPLMVNKKVFIRIIFYLLMIIPSFIFQSKGFFIGWSGLFLIGIIYILFKAKIIDKLEFFIMTMLSFVTVLYLISVPSAVVALFTMLLIHFYSKASNTIINFFGEISYSLYLIHGITGAAIINVLSHKFVATYQKPMVIMVGFIFSIVCSYLLYRFVEKPFQRKASQIKYR